MRVVLLGSPPFASPTLERLLESAHELALLVTQPDRPRGRQRRVHTSPLAERARAAGVPVLQPETTRDGDFLRSLREHEPEVLLVVSYGEILRAEVLELATRVPLNVHASLLPRWRGAAPVQRAILAGDEETGVTVQRMVLALDAGDVLLTRRTAIGAEESAGELLGRLALLGAEAALEALDLVASGRATFTPQDEAAVTRAPKLAKSDGAIDWSQPARLLARHVRAMNPWPAARAPLPRGGELLVLRARARPDLEASGEPAEIMAARDVFLVATGEGLLELLEVKPPGKRAMSASAFLRGAHMAKGALLAD